MAETDASKISENATEPKSVTVDGQTVEQHDLEDQIAADKYRRSSSAMSGNPWQYVQRTRMNPPGTV